MSFLNNIIDQVTHHGSHSNQSQQPQQQGYGGGGPPQVPPPWIAEWDNREGRWMFVNRETGERTYNYPQQQQSYYGGNSGGSGYGSGGGYGGGYGSGGQQQQPKDHSGRNMALGVGAGVLGGALLMHEGEKVEEHWKRDEYEAEDDARRAEGWAENKVSDGVQDVEDFPQDAARWTGRQEQRIEDIPQDIDNRWDNAKQDVEDIPQDVSGWAGEKVGDVERFGDGMQNAYDDGRDEARYDDDNDRNDRDDW